MAVAGLGRSGRICLFHRGRSWWHPCLGRDNLGIWVTGSEPGQADGTDTDTGNSVNCGTSVSALGPTVSKYTPENGLRGFICIVLVLIGLRYTGLF